MRDMNADDLWLIATIVNYGGAGIVAVLMLCGAVCFAAGSLFGEWLSRCRRPKTEFRCRWQPQGNLALKYHTPVPVCQHPLTNKL